MQLVVSSLEVQNSEHYMSNYVEKRNALLVSLDYISLDTKSFQRKHWITDKKYKGLRLCLAEL